MRTNFEYAAVLFRIYLEDESERANVGAIDAITRGFEANAGALFYVNADKAHKFCMAGSSFPISLSPDRWTQCVERHSLESDVHSFSEWNPPGLDGTTDWWISASMFSTDAGPVFVFLGRNGMPWTDEERRLFLSITALLSEIVMIRYRRQLEARFRHDAEEALKRTERRMMALFENSRDMIFAIDPQGVFMSINRAGVDLLGLPDAGNAVGRPFSDFIVNPETQEFFMERIRSQGYIDDHEIVLMKADGTQIYCIETAHVVRGIDGETTEILGHIKDITERIASERELWKMNLELSDLNTQLQQAHGLMVQQEKLASIGQLAAGIAHEINNPLGFLVSNQSMIKRYFAEAVRVVDSLSAAAGDAGRKIIEDAEFPYIRQETDSVFAENDEGYSRIKRIVSNLMAFSRMDKAEGFELYDLNSGVESTLVVAANEIKYVAQVRLELGNLPKIYARTGEINQVILNLLVNAAQAIGSQKRPEKGTIAVRTGIEGTMAILLISDDGPGVPDGIKDRLFDPFFTTKEPGKGTGLGLSISYDIIVNKHGGKIGFSPSSSGGTMFRIELPLVQDGSDP